MFGRDGSTPIAVAAALRAAMPRLQGRVIVWLDAQQRIIMATRLSEPDGLEVHARTCALDALQSNAQAAVLVRSAEDGRPALTFLDRRFEKMIGRILAQVNLRVLDHVILTPAGFHSRVLHEGAPLATGDQAQAHAIGAVRNK